MDTQSRKTPRYPLELVRIPVLLALFAVLFAAPASAEKMTVVVSIVPQQYFVEKIGGEFVSVQVMVEPGASPHSYEPKPRQMELLSEAALYFSIGVEFEETWLPRLLPPSGGARVVATDQGIHKEPMANYDHQEEHGEEAGHEHHGEEHAAGERLDPHIWLSPRLVAVQARTICAALASADPQHENEYRQNLETFLKEIADLDKEISAIFQALPPEKKRFMVFHPTWGYFARDYGLEQIAIQMEGKEPSPRELAELVDKARELSVTTIFTQPQFSDQASRVLADEIGATVAKLDPLAPDWAENLRQAANAFKEAIR